MAHIKWDEPGREKYTHIHTLTQIHIHTPTLFCNISQQKNNHNGFSIGTEVSK